MGLMEFYIEKPQLPPVCKGLVALELHHQQASKVDEDAQAASWRN